MDASVGIRFLYVSRFCSVSCTPGSGFDRVLFRRIWLGSVARGLVRDGTYDGNAHMGCGIDLFSLSLVYVWLLRVGVSSSILPH